jgi:hypothetical protein
MPNRLRTTKPTQPVPGHFTRHIQTTARDNYYNHIKFLEKIYGANPIEPKIKQHRRKRIHQKQTAKSYQLLRSVIT